MAKPAESTLPELPRKVKGRKTKKHEGENRAKPFLWSAF
jgi:hypothetical protein